MKTKMSKKASDRTLFCSLGMLDKREYKREEELGRLTHFWLYGILCIAGLVPYGTGF